MVNDHSNDFMVNDHTNDFMVNDHSNDFMVNLHESYVVDLGFELETACICSQTH